MNIWLDFSGHWGDIRKFSWFFFFLMHKFCLSQSFSFLKIIIYKLPTLKILGSFLSLDWCDLLELFGGERIESLCSLVEALRTDAAHYIWNSIVITFRWWHFLRLFPSCVEETLWLETIYSGNLKMLLKNTAVKCQLFTLVSWMSKKFCNPIFACFISRWNSRKHCKRNIPYSLCLQLFYRKCCYVWIFIFKFDSVSSFKNQVQMDGKECLHLFLKISTVFFPEYMGV